MSFINKIRSNRLLSNTQGLSTVEYVIILCLLAAIAVGTWSKFGGTVTEKLNLANDKIAKEVIVEK